MLTVRYFVGSGALLTGLLAANAGAQVDLAPVGVLRAEQTQRLGAFDHPVLGFSRISDLAIGPDGHLYVVQSQEAEVRVLDAEGALVGRIGRRGQGPGEFVSPAALGWRGDTLWVMDAGNRRITYFFQRQPISTYSFGVQRPVGGGTLAAQLPLANGTYAAVLAWDFDQQPVVRERRFVVLAVRNDGSIADTLGFLNESYPMRVRTGSTSISALFHDFPLFRVNGDGSGVWIVDRPFPETGRGDVTLTRVLPSGDTAVSRRVEFTSKPLTDAIWNRRAEQLFAALGVTGVNRSEYLEGSRRPAFLAPVDRMLVASTGWVWLGKTAYGDRIKEWILLDQQAIPRLIVSLPADFVPYYAAAGEVWGVSTGEFEIPYVVRYSLR